MDDLSKYFVHRCMHRWQFLWAFHKVHHSAETMTPITVYRVHPVESIIYGLRGSIVIGAVIGIFAYCFGIDNFSLATLLGVNLFSFIFILISWLCTLVTTFLFPKFLRIAAKEQQETSNPAAIVSKVMGSVLLLCLLWVLSIGGN